MKLTSDKYTFTVNVDGDDLRCLLTNTQSGQSKHFFTAGRGTPNGYNKMVNHWESMTDDLCDDWLDLEAKAAAKALAKEAEKIRREEAKVAADKTRLEKQKKKEENRKKQHEALQRKQEADSN